MFGFFIFKEVFLNLEEDCRNKILGNIFGVSNVSVSSVIFNRKSVVFRIFSESVFYQIDFFFNNSVHYKMLCYEEDIDYWIDDFNLCCDNKYYFINNLVILFKCQTEHQVYQMLRLFL